MNRPWRYDGDLDPETEQRTDEAIAAIRRMTGAYQRSRRPGAPPRAPGPPAVSHERELAWPTEALARAAGLVSGPHTASPAPADPDAGADGFAEDTAPSFQAWQQAAEPDTAPAIERDEENPRETDGRGLASDAVPPPPRSAPARRGGTIATPDRGPDTNGVPDPGPGSGRPPARRWKRRDPARRTPAAAGELAPPSRPVRHKDPVPVTGLAAQALYRHLVITPDRVIAWYRVPLQPWSFRPEAERRALVQAAAARITQLAGRRCHLRVTSRPVEVWQWAAACDTMVRGPAGRDGRRPHMAMPGPCRAHPDLSDPNCPACVPGSAWIDWLQDQQLRLRHWNLAERDVYLGVEITARSAAQRMIGQAWSRAADAERASLEQHAARVTAAVEGAGIGARACTPEELQWLFIRSCGIGLPAPLPVAQDPRPAPFALPAVAPDVTGPDGLVCYAEDFQWAAEPWAKTVQVTRAADGLTAHAAVLTLTDMTDVQDFALEQPWMQRAELLPFGAEWSVTFDVLNPRQVASLMNRQADKIRAQYAHITADHGQDAPPAMARQMELVRRIAADAENSEGPAGTWVHAWPRIVVTGETPEQVCERAAAVTEAYAPGVTVRHPPDQWRLLRELIPGELLASGANRRFMHTEVLAAGMPAATARVGQRHGFPLGVTTGWLGRRPVMWDPFYVMETPGLDRSGLVAVTGSPGGGKSTLAGMLAYMLTRAGIPVTVLDPSGMMDRLCRIPAIAAHALAVNLLESEPGTLCPYALIPDPQAADFRYAPDGRALDENAMQRAWHDARLAAEAERRALAEDILKMLLPARVLAQPGADDAIGVAVRRSPAGMDASPRDVISQLRELSDFGLQDRGPLLASRLETVADHPLARLFFPRSDRIAAAPADRRLLTVMTLRGLVIPSADRRPEDFSVEEQLSVPVLHLAAQLLRRMMFDLPRTARKAAFLDEAHALTRDAVGVQQINDMSRDSRKNNMAAFLISQNPADLLAAGIANLVGAAFAFRTEGEQELAATCGLLGLPPGRGYEARLEALSAGALSGRGTTGECLFRDGAGGLEQVQVDIGPDRDLRAALDTTPGRSAEHGFDFSTKVT